MSELLSHKEVNYRPSAGAVRRCGTCAMYRHLRTKSPQCTLVQPPIRPYSICDRYEPVEKEAA